jgi:hypothetical protein
MKNDPALARLHRSLCFDLDTIAQRFKRPEVLKLTLVIRNPEVADGDVVLTNDDYDSAIAAIQKAQSEAVQ